MAGSWCRRSKEPPLIARIPSWEQEVGECGMHPADLRMDPAAAQAVLQQFVALGYIQPPSEDQSKAVAGAVREAQLQFGARLLDRGRAQDALPLLKNWQDDPKQTRFKCTWRSAISCSPASDAKQILEALVTAD